LVGPGSVIVNVALTRAFPIREHQSVEIRAEAFNLPNLVNFYPPTTAVISPNFGKPTSTTGLGAFSSTIYDPRILQFALKYVF
jgi:hypothetical protein